MKSLSAASDGQASAKAAGLRYVADSVSGIRRMRCGNGFRYVDAGGAVIRERAEIQRIRALAIPPAWREVWICPLLNGHLQAVGRDQRGRKQYRYHERWREVRDATKYGQMIAFGAALPRIRRHIANDIRRPGLSRTKVLATVVKLLDTTLIRVGNEEYARSNKSFGLTTMRERHVDVSGARIHFHFRGKSGKEHSIDVLDRRVANILRRMLGLPGEVLFQYVNGDGERRNIEAQDVNAYLHAIAGTEFTAKDFRTWASTVLALQALQALPDFTTVTQAKHNVAAAIETVAARLGNTKAICRKCYVHPDVIDAYLAGTLPAAAAQRLRSSPTLFAPEEAATLAFLKRGQVKRPSR
ncbi:MAG TPA: DNA topoisomerase IB [Burkholderiales bacterium]|nr:DNA topoisomerase IB [Burkholderiales bacterium]